MLMKATQDIKTSQVKCIVFTIMAMVCIFLSGLIWSCDETLKFRFVGFSVGVGATYFCLCYSILYFSYLMSYFEVDK